MALLSKLFRRSYGVVDAAEAQCLVAAGALLLDVRSGPEWESGHAPGATHLPLHEVIDRGREVAGDRPVVAICRSGGRSATAARVLARVGVTAYSVRGGMDAWRRAGFDVTG
ncbi:rhodanese-like domain-containing protein [Prescottella subtropica]|uniref:rhodanese-like domain-containing protein n=1 Tax=Prescottella subtropica TaxID=2545757 RepID=UPI0010FA3055|nr:rhodanese-like domain-containing protein [Prescottella subtropica]